MGEPPTAQRPTKPLSKSPPPSPTSTSSSKQPIAVRTYVHGLRVCGRMAGFDDGVGMDGSHSAWMTLSQGRIVDAASCSALGFSTHHHVVKTAVRPRRDR